MESGKWPLHEELLEQMRKEVGSLIEAHAAGIDPDTWNLHEIVESVTTLHSDFGRMIEKEHLAKIQETEELRRRLEELVVQYYERKCKVFAPDVVARAESIVTLRAIDAHWMDHIDDMSHLREQVAFSGFAQRDPVIEYQDQGFRRFQQLLLTIQGTIVRTLLQADFAQFAAPMIVLAGEEEQENFQTNVDEIESGLQTGVQMPTAVERRGRGRAGAQTSVPVLEGEFTADPSLVQTMESLRASSPVPSQRAVPKIGRNDPCPCGSGRKYKKCHG